MYLEKHVQGNGLESLVKKIAIDQGVFAPITLVLFFLYNSLVEGKGLLDAAYKLHKVLLQICTQEFFKFFSPSHSHTNPFIIYFFPGIFPRTNNELENMASSPAVQL